MSYANTGKRWSVDGLRAYLSTVTRPTWAKSVTIHHCAAPSLAQRPTGFTAQHIENIRNYYQKQLKWSKGPHFFTDEDDVFGMTPPNVQGIHAASFNASSIGFEMLGNYDIEDPKNGRGLEVCKTTAAAALVVLDWLKLKPSTTTVLFHRDDPKTNKTCPGTKISKAWFLSLMTQAPPKIPDTLVPVVETMMQRLGVSYATAVRNLHTHNGVILWDGYELKGAFYDSGRKATVAPLSSLP
jgi:hypothetical protein